MFILDKFNYPEADVVLLMDDPERSMDLWPTRKNMVSHWDLKNKVSPI